MKKINKLIPLFAGLAILVGCSNTPTLKDGKTNVVNSDNVTVETYQDVFDSLYASKGVDVAVKELLVRVSKQVLKDSGHWTDAQIENELNARVVEKFDEFNATTYRKDGLFDENKLITSLLGKGYKITKKSAEAFKETVTNKVGYNHLKDYLTYDYSDYENELKRDMYVDLLKEEYIRSQKATSTTYFKNKDIRVVEYFLYTPANSTEANKFASEFQAKIDAAIEAGTSFKDLVTGENGLEFAWKVQKLDDLAKEFAMINKRATLNKGVNEDEAYPLPEAYAAAVKAAELKYVSDTKNGFRDIYTAEGKAALDASEITEAKDKLNSYSSNGTQSIYTGYYAKQLDILNTTYYTKTYYTADSTSLISSSVVDALEDWDKLYNDSNYLDVNKTGTAVYKNGSTYYVVYATKIDDNSSDADIKLACKQLAKFNSNVKNAIYYYLTSLTESGKLSIHYQDVYDYLNSTYSYGEED